MQNKTLNKTLKFGFISADINFCLGSGKIVGYKIPVD
jgi:hypothetical protein